MTTDVLYAESSVCGSILLDDRCLQEVADVLTEDDFALESNRMIYHAALALERRGDAVDPVTILEETGGAVSREYLMELMQTTGTAANAVEYAVLVRQASMRRAIRMLGERLSGVDEDDPRAAIADAQRELERIEAQDTARELADSGDTIADYYEHRQRVDSGGGGYVPTGFRTLDRLLGGGMLNSGFYVLAARPGMGKTTFGLAVADQVAEKQGPVLFVSLEMDEEQLAAKRLGRAAGIAYDSLMMGQLSEEERARSANWAAKLANVPFYMNRRSKATVDDISHMARRVKGIKLIVVDYFGLIRPAGRAKNRYEYMTEISGQLKAMAR